MSLLMTLVILSAVVVLFVIMTRIVNVERRVSRGYSELERADLALKAGSADAGNLLLHLFKHHPDAATYWEPSMGDAGTPGTVYLFKGRATTGNDTRLNMSNAPAPTIYARPLVSGATTKEFGDFGDTLDAGAMADEERSVNLNEAGRFGGSADHGWIGALPGEAPTPIRAQWVEILQDPTAPEDEEENPVVARYAWWVEDESFKLNVNTAKAALRGAAGSEVQTVNGEEAGHPQPSLRGLLAHDSNAAAVAAGIETARKDLKVTEGRFVSAAQVGHSGQVPAGTTQQRFAHDYKFLITAESSGLDLSRAGVKRLPLNDVVRESIASGDRVAAIGLIEEAIKASAPDFGQRYYRAASSTKLAETISATVAGQKNALVVSSTHSDLYLRKLATNLYDYISPEINPTVLDDAGELVSGRITTLDDLELPDNSGVPTEADNPVHAFGKKNIPYLTEYGWIMRQLSSQRLLTAAEMRADPELEPYVGGPMPKDSSGNYRYEVAIDHYFELWNLSGEVISPEAGDLGPNPFIVLENQPYITANNDGGRSTNDVGVGRNFMIRLTDDFRTAGGTVGKIEFPPNEVVVITTNPDPAAAAAGLASGAKVYSATALYDPDSDPANPTRVDGAMSMKPFPDPDYAPVKVSNVRLYQLTSYDARTSDWGEIQIAPGRKGQSIGRSGTRYFMGNDNGLLDVAPGLSLHKHHTNNVANIVSGVSMTRSSAPVDYGDDGGWDPRNKLDAVSLFMEGASTGDIFNGLHSALRTVVNFADLGRITIAPGQMWESDKVPASAGNATNPPVGLSGGWLRSIGELGNVYDPALASNIDAASRLRRRGGGRTVILGQADPYWDGTRRRNQTATELSYQVSNSREWAAWRLADIFTARRDDQQRGAAKAEVAGLYNPNGILRDEGRVLRGLLEGVQFGSTLESDAGLTGKTLDTSGTTSVEASKVLENHMHPSAGRGGQALAYYLMQRMQRRFPQRFSPLWERGELSQLPLFTLYDQLNANTRSHIAVGSNVITMNDRGREELFRRLGDLITAKGNTYSIYVVGQSLYKNGKPSTTRAQKITVRLRPEWDAPVAEREKYLLLPDRWNLEVVSIEEAS